MKIYENNKNRKDNKLKHYKYKSSIVIVFTVSPSWAGS